MDAAYSAEIISSWKNHLLSAYEPLFWLSTALALTPKHPSSNQTLDGDHHFSEHIITENSL